MADLLMVGSVAYDSVETPHGKVDHALGGAATYAAVAASFFAPSRIVGVVGDDFDQEHVRFLGQRGIDLQGLQHADGRTFHWAGVYEQDMNVRTTLLTELNVFERFDPVLPESYRASEYLLLANIHPSLQLKVLAQAVSPKFVALDTMNLWIDIARDDLDEAVSKVNLLLLNDEEARMLADDTNLFRAADKLLARGPRVLIIKKGEHGAMMVTGDGLFVLPAYPVATVKDPTGCGDCFAGGFLGWLAACDSTDDPALRAAMAHGTVVASFNVEDFSLDRLRTLTRQEIDRRYQEFRHLTAIEPV